MSESAASFNPQRRDLLPPTPSLESVLRRAMRHASQSLRVCLPARVVQADSRHRVDVLPLLQAKYAVENDPTTLPIVCGVPVSMPSGGAWRVSGPVAKGDQGLLIFADRSLDNWLAGDGDPADPQDGRCHNLTDAIFVPGLLTDSQAAAANDASGDLTLAAGQAELRLQQAGTITLGNGQQELMSLLVQLTDALLQAQTITALGPSGFWGQTILALGQVKAGLSALKGSSR